MKELIDLTGRRYGYLTVLGRDYDRKTRGKVFWMVQCDCGTIKSVDGSPLRDGRTKSCGCRKRERFIQMTHTQYTDLHKENKRLSSIWYSMINRCYLETHKQYHNYGGRGIAVCNEWRSQAGFEAFVEWAKANGYNDHLTLDRIDVNGCYCPDNCRWISHKQQQNNRTNNRYVEHNGETKTLTEWCNDLGLNYRHIEHRVRDLGMPFDVAIVMDGLPKIIYNGKEITIRRVAQMEHIDYKKLLYKILVEDEEPDAAIRMIQQMEQG